MAPAARQAALWGILLPAALIMSITMGSRQVTGLFISPMNTSTGIGVAGLSFALAVGQFVWGATQPVFGALADRFGPIAVMIAGTLMLATGLAITPLMTTEWGMVFAMGVLTAAGAGAASFSILISIAAQYLPPERRSFSAGFINAGGSFGQFVFAPLAERLIAVAGWVNAMIALAATTLLAIPLILSLRRQRRRGVSPTGAEPGKPGSTGSDASSTERQDAAPVAAPPALTLRAQLRIALRDRSYLLLHLGFLTCGFHVAFLITHLPGEIAVCGLPATVAGVSIAIIGLANIAGSLGAGWLGNRYRMKSTLFWIYTVRAVLILGYLAAPKVALTLYVFAAGMGLTFLASVPPTAGLVGKLFGVRYLATLFGLTLLSHQIGGFLGAWLGGLAFEANGDYLWMWYADAALALFAGLVHLPIREAPVRWVAA